MTKGLFQVEVNSGKDGFEAGSNLVEFLRRNVLDARDLATAKVVAGEVEAEAGAAMIGGIDLVALGDADVLLLVVAVDKRDVVDVSRDGLRLGAGEHGLPGANGCGRVRSDAEVNVSAGEGGRREWIL